MRIQLQPNKWSCIPTALAMLLDENVEDIINEIGHDGSEIICSNLSDPHGRIGFHPQEMVKICLERGKALIQFDGEVQTCKEECKSILHYRDYKYINGLMKNNSGIILGVINNRDHAVTWNHEEGCIYDPNGTKYAKGFFAIESFLMIKNLSAGEFSK
jgi:hypothetical protein